MFALVLIFTLAAQSGHQREYPVYLHYPTRFTCEEADMLLDKRRAKAFMTRRLAPQTRVLKLETVCWSENALI